MASRMTGLFMHMKIKSVAKGMNPIATPMEGFMLRAVHRHKHSPDNEAGQNLTCMGYIYFFCYHYLFSFVFNGGQSELEQPVFHILKVRVRR